MNAVRIPTAAENAAIQRDHARRYAEVQAMRSDVAAAGMACCDADDRELGMVEILGLLATSVGGFALMLGFGYAVCAWLAGVVA